MELTKRQLELVARACLALAADENTKDETANELDDLYDYFNDLAEECVEEW